VTGRALTATTIQNHTQAVGNIQKQKGVSNFFLSVVHTVPTYGSSRGPRARLCNNFYDAAGSHQLQVLYLCYLVLRVCLRKFKGSALKGPAFIFCTPDNSLKGLSQRFLTIDTFGKFNGLAASGAQHGKMKNKARASGAMSASCCARSTIRSTICPNGFSWSTNSGEKCIIFEPTVEENEAAQHSSFVRLKIRSRVCPNGFSP